MEFDFVGPVVEWRGPAPYFYVRIPPEVSDDVKDAAKGLEYWGQVPVVARIDEVESRTALFPKDGVYLLPLRAAVRREIGADVDEELAVEMSVGAPPRGTMAG